MFKWLRQTAENKIVQSHLSEMIPWLTNLSVCSDEEVARLYVTALVYSNEYKKKRINGYDGIDLFNPQDALEKYKFIAVELGHCIREAQRDSNHSAAAALTVWLFTMRSAMNDELRPVGVEIWRQIRRGFPYVISCFRII